jgi:phosphatidylglycerophosphate synthase
MDASPIDSALVLTTGGIFDPTGAPSPPSPLTVVGGLSLLQRTIMTLQRAGITRLVMLGGDKTEAMQRQLQGDRRIQIEVGWLPIREFPLSDPRTWEGLSGMLGSSYLVAGTRAVFSPDLVIRLREEGRKGDPVLVVRNADSGRTRRDSLSPGRQDLPSHSGVPMAPQGVKGHGRGESEGAGGVVTLEPAVASSLFVDLVSIPEGFTSPGWVNPQDSPHPLRTALERGLRSGQVKVLPLEADWYQEVRTGAPEEVASAEWTLLRSLKGGLEGFVDRHFNRKCSKWITQWLVGTPLTPNGVTILATAVGLLAATAFGLGGYAEGIIGALLFQLSAILDCCDGEVARLKFLESSMGEQLDVVLDNVVHVALYAGIAWASYRDNWGPVALLFGWLAMLGNLFAFVVVQKATRMRGALDPDRRRYVESILNTLVSRDFSVLILVLALVNHVEWFLPLAAIGSNVFWPLLAWQLRTEKRSASPPIT